MLAYYMMVNHGWRPQQVDDLPEREEFLMLQFALRELRSRPKAR